MIRSKSTIQIHMVYIHIHIHGMLYKLLNNIFLIGCENIKLFMMLLGKSSTGDHELLALYYRSVD